MESEEKSNINQLLLTFRSKSNEIIRVSKISKEDAWSLCDFVIANEDRLSDSFPLTREQNLTPELSEIFVTLKEKQFLAREEYLFTLRSKESNRIIGLIYIKKLDWTKKQGEFAYAIDYNYEGKGIISMVIKELSAFAFQELELEILQIITHKTNIGSCKVAENNDFQWIKTLSNEFTPRRKKPLDMELYELYK